MQPLMEVKDLTHIYSAGTPFEQVALDHINLQIYEGELLGIIGHTGSGKSTLMQHLNGLLKPTTGQILLDGVDIWKDKQTTRQTRFQVGLVFQYPEYQLFEENVYREIAFGPKNMGLDEEEIRRRVMQAAEFTEVDPKWMDKSPFDLSGGQKRRVAIAGVIAMEPRVLILDEPTAGLDPAGRAGLLRSLRAYQRAKRATVVMVSHSMEDMADIADRLLVMNHAKIALQGTPKEVFSHAEELIGMGLSIPQVTQVFLRLRELGVEVDPAVYTIEQAVAAITARRGGRHA